MDSTEGEGGLAGQTGSVRSSPSGESGRPASVAALKPLPLWEWQAQRGRRFHPATFGAGQRLREAPLRWSPRSPYAYALARARVSRRHATPASTSTSATGVDAGVALGTRLSARETVAPGATLPTVFVRRIVRGNRANKGSLRR